MTLEDIEDFHRTMSLQESERKLETTRQLFFDSLVKGDNPDLTEKYLNAYKLMSNIHFGRKYGKIQ